MHLIGVFAGAGPGDPGWRQGLFRSEASKKELSIFLFRPRIAKGPKMAKPGLGFSEARTRARGPKPPPKLRPTALDSHGGAGVLGGTARTPWPGSEDLGQQQ